MKSKFNIAKCEIFDLEGKLIHGYFSIQVQNPLNEKSGEKQIDPIYRLFEDYKSAREYVSTNFNL